MKIGLLSYHAVCNFGATLQLLSTCGYLRKHGHTPIIINWVPKDLEEGYKVHTPDVQYKRQQELRKHIWIETPLCRTMEEIAKVIVENGIEAVIIGSDAVCQHHTLLERIVFPCHKIIAIQKSTSDRLFPNPFWALWNRLLPRPIPVVMISASCQDSVYSYFSNKLCREMATQINSFKYVSVRDEWTQEMFRHVTRNKINPPITPDPVFAFMPNAGDMLPSFGELRRKFDLPDKYFLFSFHNGKTVSQKWLDDFQTIAQKEDILCINLPFSEKESFGRLEHSIHLPVTPLEWFALIKYSSGYIGHNMHPIVVSLHCGVPFFSFDNYGLKHLNGILTTDRSSKIKHILTRAGLLSQRESCISRNYHPLGPDIVYQRIKEFPFDRSLNFSNQYYNYYLQMMEEITNSFLSEVQA